jgi:hypothetical protein
MAIAEKDLIVFKNRTTGVQYTGEVVEVVSEHTLHVKIIESTDKMFVGHNRSINLASSKIEVVGIRKFESRLAKDNAEYYLALCHAAVDINDKQWFQECHAQYSLWKAKIEGEKLIER